MLPDVVAAAPGEVAPEESGRIFDFSVHPSMMDQTTYNAFYAYRHTILTTSNETDVEKLSALLPDGRKISESEVGKVIGPTRMKSLGLTVTPEMKDPKNAIAVEVEQN